MANIEKKENIVFGDAVKTAEVKPAEAKTAVKKTTKTAAKKAAAKTETAKKAVETAAVKAEAKVEDTVNVVDVDVAELLKKEVLELNGAVEPVKEEKSTTTKKEEKSSTSFDEGQQQAINSVLANSGLEQSDVTNITCSLDEASQQYTVTFTFQDVHNTCAVDSATFVVLSSVQA